MRRGKGDQLREMVAAVIRRVHPTRSIFVVTCRACGRIVPAGFTEFPFHSVAVECCLCGKTLKYRPSEVTLGAPHSATGTQGNPPTENSRKTKGRILLFAARPRE
jgi:hypothetical protein